MEIMDGTLTKSRRAWLITWDWLGDHAKVENRFVALLNPRCSGDTVKRVVEHIYISRQLALHEQLAYVKHPKSSLYCAQFGNMEVGRTTRERLHLPPVVPCDEEVTCGDNPWLWARIVYDLIDKSYKHRAKLVVAELIEK
jgi:hypothetical protein